jgi:antibiotic biosynthesis monooxygenase (ABM) superfamily enzyme
MTQPPVSRSRNAVAAHPVTSAAIAVLTIAVVFFALYVPLYASATPKVGDFPFFYFYLLIYMPVVAIVCWIIIVLQKRLRSGDASRAPGADEVSAR